MLNARLEMLTQRFTPRRNSYSLLPSCTRNTRITVPFSDAVATLVPDGLNPRAASGLSWAGIIVLACWKPVNISLTFHAPNYTYNDGKKGIHHFPFTQHKNSAPSVNSTWEFHFIGCIENSEYVTFITNNLQRRSISTFHVIRKFDFVKQNTNVFWGHTMSPLPIPTKILTD